MVDSAIEKTSQILLSPGLEEHGCHAMILLTSYHDRWETKVWSGHDNGMAVMFFDIVAMLHGMI